MSKANIILLFLCIMLSPIARAKNVKIVNLKTEYSETPLGIDITNPRFSWQMKSQGYGFRQSAYQIVVTDEARHEIWNSGKILDDASLNIKYAGTKLQPCSRYVWKVYVWDQKQERYNSESWFETGLMNSNPYSSAWNGAKWIGGKSDNMVLYSPYLPVFKVNYSIRLDKKNNSVKAGFIYGANDRRLMSKNENLYQIENKPDSSYLLVELDISPLETRNSAILNIFRVGYHPKDKKDFPLKSFYISKGIINNENKYDSHTVYISSVLGYTRIYIDGESKEKLIGEVNVNPLGNGGDYIAFPIVGEIGFAVPQKQTAYFSDVEIRNYRSPSNLLFHEDLHNQAKYQGIFSQSQKPITIKDSSYQVEGTKIGTFIVADPSRNSMPMLRTTFSTKGRQVYKARLYVTSRGIYEMYINGKRIGSDYFNPGLTQYNKTQFYQTYDVTNYIIPGNKNAIGAILGEGWWSGASTYMGEFWNFFGDNQSLLSKLVIIYSDGTEDIIVTNPSTWTYYNNGPIIYSSLFQGEVYDASKEFLVKDWSTATYDDAQWKEADEITLNGHISKEGTNSGANMPVLNDYATMSLVGQIGETVSKIKEITAISVEEMSPGVFLYDMGQNMAGVPKISLSDIKAGKKILLRFAEVKYPDLPAYKKNAGMIMLENIRAAMAQDVYITKGGDETINPRFTYHGYRYVEIAGIEKPLPLDAVKGEVLSSIHKLDSKYETSNPKVNKLWENITWSSFANFMSIPTDCPQRNERLGWSGDISVFSRTATYLANIPQFLRRHMLAMRDAQRKNGRFSDVAPLDVGFGETMWGSAGITVPWESYQQYGDKDMLAEHYDAMKKYIEYLISDINPTTNILKEKERNSWGSLGDWLSLEDGRNEKLLFWEAYFIYDLEIMNKAAIVLDKKEDAIRFARLCAERKEFFNKTYIDKETKKTAFEGKLIDTQTSYVLPFAFNILNGENKDMALTNFVATITRENKTDSGDICPPYSLMTGFIGTAWINKALSDNGYTNLAYNLLQQTTYPSWLYPIEQGATTIWERLNSYTHKDGFGGNNGMNSFNHYSFGAVGAWMYDHSLGIQRDENYPAFKHFLLRPEPDPTGNMTYAKGYYDSMYGRIESSWSINRDCYLYDFTIPANSSATLELKAHSINNIVEDNKLFNLSEGVKFIKEKDGKFVFELQPGTYNIKVIK